MEIGSLEEQFMKYLQDGVFYKGLLAGEVPPHSHGKGQINPGIGVGDSLSSDLSIPLQLYWNTDPTTSELINGIIDIRSNTSTLSGLQKIVQIGVVESTGPVESGRILLLQNGTTKIALQAYTDNPSYFNPGSGGKFGFGTDTPGFPVTIDSSMNSDSAPAFSLLVQGVANKERVAIRSAVASTFSGQRFNGTLSTPTVPLANEILAGFGGTGYDGSVFQVANRGGFNVFANQNWTTTAQGTYVTFLTTANGATSATTRLTIRSDGYLQHANALIALGGGAAATLGTIGGTGPTVAAQNTWLQMYDSGGISFWIPVWK